MKWKLHTQTKEPKNFSMYRRHIRLSARVHTYRENMMNKKGLLLHQSVLIGAQQNLHRGGEAKQTPFAVSFIFPLPETTAYDQHTWNLQQCASCPLPHQLLSRNWRKWAEIRSWEAETRTNMPRCGTYPAKNVGAQHLS